MLKFQLISLTGPKFDDQVSEVLLPTLSGHIGVLTGHMPLVSVATRGVVAVRRQPKDRDEDMEYFAVSGGVIEVSNNHLSLLVDEADYEEDINLAEAQKAYDLAQKMKVEAKDQLSLNQAQSLLDRQAVRLQVANLRRKHHR